MSRARPGFMASVGQKAGPDEGSANSPDPSRFGWVPLRVIKKVKRRKNPKEVTGSFAKGRQAG